VIDEFQDLADDERGLATVASELTAGASPDEFAPARRPLPYLRHPAERVGPPAQLRAGVGVNLALGWPLTTAERA
jgi:hypothetical protein